jgi:LysR family transcriptional activator of glutamate synthase operon
MRIPRVTMDMLVAVVALADKKTLEKAAAEIGLVTPSAIHKRIRAVNLMVGSPLFVNTEQGMILTEVGESFYPDAVHAVEEALLAEEKVTALLGLKASRLLVGHSTYLPPRLLAAVLKLSFDKPAGIHIEHISGLTANLADRVAEGSLHGGFGYLPVQRPELLSRVLYEEDLVVCMSSAHRLAVQHSIRPSDLADEPFIAVAHDTFPGLHREVEDFFAGFGIALHVVAETLGPPEAVTLVEQRIGICLLGASAALRPGVVSKTLAPRAFPRKSGLFVREDNRHPMVKALMDRALEMIPSKARQHPIVD